MNFFRLPPIDLFSFWLGFAVAALMALGLYALRRQLAAGRNALAHRFKNLRELFTSGTERNFRKDILRLAQTSHLAGNVFALDALLLPPRLLVPDPDPDPTLPPPEDDLTLVIPRLAEWPELAALYRAPTLSAAEAFSGPASILVLGSVGSGKSTLLAHLASRAAQEDDAGLFKNATPIWIHAGDVETAAGPKDVLQPLIGAAQARASRVIAPQLPRHLRLRLREFACVIFIDGFDELPPARIAEVAAWLEQFRKVYPHHRLIAAADAWGHGPLLALGLAPIWLAPWNTDDYHALIEKWSAAWQQHPTLKKKSALADVEAVILAGWLNGGNAGRSIFEVTLKIWGAFAGDTRGNRPVDWLETFIARAGLPPVGLKALGKMAVVMLAHENSGLPRKDLAALLDPVLAGAEGKARLDSDDFLDALISKRLLIKRAGERLSFRHGLAGAYCAALGLTTDPAGLTPGLNPGWTRALAYFAPVGDLTPHVGQRLTQAPDLLQTDVLTCARWLRDAPLNAKWRGEIYRRLTQLLLNAQQPESLRLRALAAFVAAHDPTVASLFKQALANAEPFLRRMATLGLGALADPANVPVIAALLADPYLDVRWAATLALAVTGSEKAIDMLIHALAEGDDDLRRASAQALARNEEQGHALLKEALHYQDLGARRAAVYGLADTRQPWVQPLLEEALAKETEWFVRSALTEILEQWKQGPAEQLPRPYLPPEAQGWLIAWAATQGQGVPPGKAAVDVLNKALDKGEARTKHAAAEAIGRLADPASARQLYNIMREPDMLLRDVAFRALAHVSTAAAQRLAAPN